MKNYKVYIYSGHVKISKENYSKKINQKSINDNINSNVILTKEFETYSEAVYFAGDFNYNVSIKFIDNFYEIYFQYGQISNLKIKYSMQCKFCADCDKYGYFLKTNESCYKIINKFLK